MEEKKRARETHIDQLATSPGNSLALSLVGYFFSLLLAFLLITNISIPLEPVSIPLQHRCVSAGARAEDGLTIEKSSSLALASCSPSPLPQRDACERKNPIDSAPPLPLLTAPAPASPASALRGWYPAFAALIENANAPLEGGNSPPSFSRPGFSKGVEKEERNSRAERTLCASLPLLSLFASSFLASPRLASPRLASPRLASPRLASPRLASPRLLAVCWNGRSSLDLSNGRKELEKPLLTSFSLHAPLCFWEGKKNRPLRSPSPLSLLLQN